MRYLLTSFCFCFLLGLDSISAQIFTIDSTSIETCTGQFRDSGNQAPYLANESFTSTICSDSLLDNHVLLSFQLINLGTGDTLCLYDGADVNAPLLACFTDSLNTSTTSVETDFQATVLNSSGCITVTFVSDDTEEGAGWSANISCQQVCQTVEAILVNTIPAMDTINICLGGEVFFEGTGAYPQNGLHYNQSDNTSTFSWNFGDGAVAEGNNVSRIYSEPGGYVTQLIVIDTVGCISTNLVRKYIRVAGQPTVELSSFPASYCEGDTVELKLDSVLVNNSIEIDAFTGFFEYSNIVTDSLFLPDGNGEVYNTNISVTSFSNDAVLTNIDDLEDICVNMEHSYMGDLEIVLTCPNGTSVLLHEYGSTGGTYLGEPIDVDSSLDAGIGYDYCWTMEATETWAQAAFFAGTLPAGDYLADGNLSDLVGCPLNGFWTLTITDNLLIDNGYIFGWELGFNSNLFEETPSFSSSLIDLSWVDNPSVIYASADSISSLPNAGNIVYKLEASDSYGCDWDLDVPITVLPFQHPDCYNCESLITPLSDTSTCEPEPVLLEVAPSSTITEAVSFEAVVYDDIYLMNNSLNNTLNVNSLLASFVDNPITDIVSICVDMETTFLGAITLELIAPSGEVLELSSENGGATDEYANTCFTPTATTNISDGIWPYTGDFQPEGDWTSLTGASLNGDWQLRISHSITEELFVELNYWSITFNNTNEVVYQWTPSDNLSCSDCPNPIATSTEDITYIIEAIDDYNCMTQDSITIFVPGLVAAPEVDCEVTGVGELTFSWAIIDMFAVYEVNINNEGWMVSNTPLSHVLTGLAEGEEIEIAVRVYQENSLCSVEIGTANCSYLGPCNISIITDYQGVSCFGVCDGAIEALALDGTAPVLYELTNTLTGEVLENTTGLFDSVCAGEYIMSAKDTAFCIASETIELLSPNEILAVLEETQSIDCAGNANACISANVTGGAGGFSFEWNAPNAQTDTLICNVGAGVLSFIATDINGCSLTTQISVEEPEVFEGQAFSEDLECFGNDDGLAGIAMTGGTLPYTYNWDVSNQDITFLSDLAPGSYSLTVVDANGCEFIEVYEIGSPTEILVASDVQNTSTEQSNIGAIIINEVQGGIAPYDIHWSTGATTMAITNLSVGNYSVTVTDDNDCQYVETFYVDFEVGSFEVESDFVDIQITPNPIAKHAPIVIQFDNSQAQEVQIEIMNELGQVCLQKEISIVTGHSTIQLLHTLTPSIYFVKIKNDNLEYLVRRVVVY